MHGVSAAARELGRTRLTASRIGLGLAAVGRPAYIALLLDVAREHELTPDVLALAAVLNQPWADVVLSGAATPEQLRSNLAALEIVVDNPLQVRLGHLAEPPEQYWSKRARLAWA